MPRGRKPAEGPRSSGTPSADTIEALRAELRAAQEALEDARDRLHEAWHFSPVGLFTLAADGTIRDVNLPAAAQLGVERSSLLGQPFTSFVAPEDAGRWGVVFPSLLPAGEQRSLRIRLRHSSGNLLPVGLACRSRATRQAGAVVEIASSDLSDQARTEERFRAWIDFAPNAIFVVDGGGRFLEVNPAGVALTGLDAAALRSRSVGDLVAPAARALVARDLATLKAAGSVEGVYPLSWPDGRVTWVRVRASRLPGGDFLSICEDVTAARRSEEALRESEARFRALASGAPVGIFQTGPTGQATYVNPAFLSITGLSEAEAYAPDAGRQSIHPDDQDWVARAWRNAVATGKTFSGDYRLRHRGGKVKWVRGFGTALRDASGAVTGFVGVLVDIFDPPPR